MLFSSPGHWGKLSALDRTMIEARQHGGKIFAYWNFQSAAALYHREDGGDLRSSLSAAEMYPVLSAHGDGAHGVFRQAGG